MGIGDPDSGIRYKLQLPLELLALLPQIRPLDKNDKNRAIALAAIFQACGLTHQLAYKGEADDKEIRPLLQSLFVNDASSIGPIYGDLSGLKTGFTLLTGLLRNPGQGQESTEISRYLVSLMQLEQKLAKDKTTGDAILQGLEKIKRQKDYFDDVLSNSVVAGLAGLYQETISKLGPKIIIKGEQIHLGNPDTAARIRALLLSGVRSAVLWRQAGGGRLKLMLRRRQMIEQAEAFLEQP